jgi:hypothetical protein
MEARRPELLVALNEIYESRTRSSDRAERTSELVK